MIFLGLETHKHDKHKSGDGETNWMITLINIEEKKSCGSHDLIMETFKKHSQL